MERKITKKNSYFLSKQNEDLNVDQFTSLVVDLQSINNKEYAVQSYSTIQKLHFLSDALNDINSLSITDMSVLRGLYVQSDCLSRTQNLILQST